MLLISAGFILIFYEYNFENKQKHVVSLNMGKQWLKSEDKICSSLLLVQNAFFFL